jgi:RNA polymerase sigma-70 factor (ECF subfamily)
MSAEKDESKSRGAMDEEVLKLLKAEHPNAADRLVDIFGNRIYGLSLRILTSEEDAQEAVQETFLTIWRKWPTFKEKSKFSSWVYRIAANQAYMKLRKKMKRRGEVSLEELSNKQHTALGESSGSGRLHPWIKRSLSPDQELERDELRTLIEKAIQSLEPIYRMAYMLKDIAGMSLREIAEVMNLSEAAVKSRVHRARLEVRKRLEPLL